MLQQGRTSFAPALKNQVFRLFRPTGLRCVFGPSPAVIPESRPFGEVFPAPSSPRTSVPPSMMSRHPSASTLENRRIGPSGRASGAFIKCPFFKRARGIPKARAPVFLQRLIGVPIKIAEPCGLSDTGMASCPRALTRMVVSARTNDPGGTRCRKPLNAKNPEGCR